MQLYEYFAIRTSIINLPVQKLFRELFVTTAWKGAMSAGSVTWSTWHVALLGYKDNEQNEFLVKI